MSTDLTASFNEQYMSINSKLKKRFLRKPNITEATNQFVALAVQCEHLEQPAFSGQAFVGAAKCEAAAGHIYGEADMYVMAGRQYMTAEKKLRALKFYSPDRENLEAAIGCYTYAASKYSSDCILKLSVLVELANQLMCLNQKTEALYYYDQAYAFAGDDKNVRRICMENMLTLQIECDRLDLALETANNICDDDFQTPEDILIELQVTRILLTLLLEPPEETKPASLKQLFEDLLADSDKLPFHTDLKLKLQSIVISCMQGDVGALIRVSADARYIMTAQQANILDRLKRKTRDAFLIIA